MEQKELERIGIGEEIPPLEAKKVKVQGWELVTVKKDDKEIGEKVVLKVEHPDQPDLEISKVKYEQNKKLKVSGTWLTLDKDGKIAAKSALANLLRYNKCATIISLVNETIETTTDENGYIIAKAY